MNKILRNHEKDYSFIEEKYREEELVLKQDYDITIKKLEKRKARDLALLK